MKPLPADRAVKARRRAPRRKTISYSVAMKVRMAYLAGLGRTGRQIAEEIGVDEPKKVRAVLRSMGIKLLHEAGAMDLIMVRVPRPVSAAVLELADLNDLPTDEFAARVLTLMCVEERVVLANLMDTGQDA